MTQPPEILLQSKPPSRTRDLYKEIQRAQSESLDANIDIISLDDIPRESTARMALVSSFSRHQIREAYSALGIDEMAEHDIPVYEYTDVPGQQPRE